MPGGPSPVGFVYFVATKLVGYTAFSAYAINRSEAVRKHTEIPAPSPIFAGVVRTAIGVGVGAIVGTMFWKLPNVVPDRLLDDGLFFLYLVPFRVGEWWLLLATVYRSFSFGNWKAGLICGGILTSFALDATGLALAFILPGGFWVC
jgi:hypothetical protein